MFLGLDTTLVLKEDRSTTTTTMVLMVPRRQALISSTTEMYRASIRDRRTSSSTVGRITLTKLNYPELTNPVAKG